MKHFSWFAGKQYAVQLFSTPDAGLSDFFQCLSSSLPPSLQAYFPALLLLFLPLLSLPAPFHSQRLLTSVSHGRRPGCECTAQPFWRTPMFSVSMRRITNYHSSTIHLLNKEETCKHIIQTAQKGTQMVLPFRELKKKVHCLEEKKVWLRNVDQI